ncbi:MAG: hypothetical protein JXJ17_18395 [Anaerolineae bacterium]|nr:hypothetical protein [Anaerolineae bacterium]
MDERERLVVKGLTGYRKPDDIIMELCQKYDMQWNEASRFVALVREENRDKISSKQNVFMKAMSIFFMVGGAMLSLGILIATLSGVIIFFLRLPIPYLGNVVFFFLGAAIVVGGARGLVQKPEV